MFKKVVITDKKREKRVFIDNQDKLLSYIKKYPNAVELIGGDNQIKPCFDIDAFDNKPDLIEITSIINKIFPDKIIHYAYREPRQYKDKGIKYSYRAYVQGVRISYTTLKDLITDTNLFDTSIYKSNALLLLPFTTKKLEDNNIHPPIIPINCSIFDCCASYIEEDYENWDLKAVKSPVQQLLERINDTHDEQTTNLNFTEIMTKLSKERATIFDLWKDVGISLTNVHHRKIITRGQLYTLFDLFSSKADNYDANGVIKFLETNIPRFNGKGYGIKYLLECLKNDDEEYYKSITKKDMIIDGANDDIGASEIVVNHYKEFLIVCKGVLYVNDNDIWVSNEKQVDKLLIDMIGKLDIKFIGADGKRKYAYNKSIKHIKDCIICIKAKKTIINDKFYDNMIKNNKYYLPFNDGIYSFKDKKLYSYKELPNVNFTYKINRNFPIFNQDDYDELMKKVINPIYPNEEEKNYNAHIKARALAGCYEDKKWYGYSGSRNSGKGTETGILKSAFGDFVMDFNAKCLVLTRFTNPDSAKSLSWVVDKRNARIIISNEIDGDDNTILNGAFIKTLASGGDAMECRKNYQDEISFIPQFTMFLCYNRFYKVEPSDALENLEQFEYKSKFVDANELIEGVSFLKLKDDNIKEFVKQDKIIDAYTLYILNSFTDPRMKTPQLIINSTEIGNGDIGSIPVETFIIKNFKNTNDYKDRIHTETICDILNGNGYKINIIETGKLMSRIGIGKYNKNCNIDKLRKCGYDYIKYLG